jgi:hypothetical protein
MAGNDDGFLARWSRRKQAERHGTPPADRDAAPASHEAEDTALEAARATGEAPNVPQPTTEERFRDLDFDSLDAGSDYKPFMAADVPDHIRTKALARLWVSDPILAAPDPFSDCVGDFTDAACAVPGGLLRTAYKVGQGFLSDEEAAVWDRLGRPAVKPAADGAAPDDAASEVPEGAASAPDLPPIAKAIAAVHAQAAAGSGADVAVASTATVSPPAKPAA